MVTTQLTKLGNGILETASTCGVMLGLPLVMFEEGLLGSLVANLDFKDPSEMLYEIKNYKREPGASRIGSTLRHMALTYSFPFYVLGYGIRRSIPMPKRSYSLL